MSCYHPMIRSEDIGKWVTAKDGHRYHPAKVFDCEEWMAESLRSETPYRKQTLIPCGRCIGCRLDYSREWANRGYLESKLWEQNWYVTITYDEDHLPLEDEYTTKDGITYTEIDSEEEWTGKLVPEHLTQFIKNVRQIMKREYGLDGIRFMACGEYGTDRSRPHYHIIFFNLPLAIYDLYSPKIIDKRIHYKSHIMERAWGKGIVDVEESNWNAIAYVARYITKKINGPLEEEEYWQKGKEKEFFRVSRMPGIGEGYYRKHWKEIYERDEIIINNRSGTISTKPPKYFDELFKKEHPEEYKKLQAKRKREGINSAKIKDMQTSISRMERLLIEERTKDEKTQSLIRQFESAK